LFPKTIQFHLDVKTNSLAAATFVYVPLVEVGKRILSEAALFTTEFRPVASVQPQLNLLQSLHGTRGLEKE
jgi:hypothetical protein